VSLPGGIQAILCLGGIAPAFDVLPGVNAGEGADLVDRGRKLQLVLYALAAREARRDHPPSRVEAYYWFVEQGALRRGAPIGSSEEQRLLDVLDVEVSGIRHGVFPANPGEWDSRGFWKNCGYCPYHRICPSTRGEIYERVRTHEAVAAYDALAHPPGAGEGG
jgi:ATP-dependent helicase/nuclease subunit B